MEVVEFVRPRRSKMAMAVSSRAPGLRGLAFLFWIVNELENKLGLRLHKRQDIEGVRFVFLKV